MMLFAAENPFLHLRKLGFNKKLDIDVSLQQNRNVEEKTKPKITFKANFHQKIVTLLEQCKINFATCQKLLQLRWEVMALPPYEWIDMNWKSFDPDDNIEEHITQLFYGKEQSSASTESCNL